MSEDRNLQDKSSSNSRNTSSSTTTYSSHGAGRTLSEVDKLAILSAYNACVGDTLQAPMAYLIGNLYQRGMDADVIVHAIELTGFARKPTPWYLRAILTRYEGEGIKTLADVTRDEHQFEERKGMQAELPW